MSEDPKPIGVDVAVPKFAVNQQRPEGPRGEKAIGSGEGSQKGSVFLDRQKRKRPLGISPARNEANVGSVGRENAALLRIYSLFSPTIRKNPATEVVAATKLESQNAKPVAREPSSTETPVESEPAGGLLPLTNTVRGHSRKQRPGDKLEPIEEDETLEMKENCPDAPDIDSVHKGNQLLCSFYAKQIFDNYQRRERMFVVPANYLKHQDEDVARDRIDVVDWIVGTHSQMRLKMETLFLAISYMDRYLAVKKIARTEFHVLGATCLFMAGKYEEMIAPRTKDIIDRMDITTSKKSIKTRDAMLEQERRLFSALEGFSALPTVYIFVLRYVQAAGYLDAHEVTTYCMYLTELVLYCHHLQSIRPSKLAAAIVLAARIEMREPDHYPAALWSHSKHSLKSVLPIAEELNTLAKNQAKNQTRVTQGGHVKFYSAKKYASSKKYKVSVYGLTKIQKKRNLNPAVAEPEVDVQSRKIARTAGGARLRTG
ncbi:hypothetical protein BSKO_10453 [Bryopsis sp. KO-2023]|nr:hypothetical protein BSKO_10453 [Bryopsis sp. KO-2023]